MFFDVVEKRMFSVHTVSENFSPFISSSSSRTSDGQSSLADKCCSLLQIREAAVPVELLGLQGWSFYLTMDWI